MSAGDKAGRGRRGDRQFFSLVIAQAAQPDARHGLLFRPGCNLLLGEKSPGKTIGR